MLAAQPHLLGWEQDGRYQGWHPTALGPLVTMGHRCHRSPRPWRLLLCSSCGSCGTHQLCSDIGEDISSWECSDCADTCTGESCS